MRTAIIITAGLALLGLGFALHSWFALPRKFSTFTSVFIIGWFLIAATNMWIGVARAGYSWAEELPIFLIIFGISASAALLLRYWIK